MKSQQSNPESRQNLSHATIFVWLFAISAIWHYTSSGTDISSYWFRYDALVTPLVFLSIASAFIAACYPSKTLAVLVMCIAHLIAISLRFPFVPDHMVMELFLILSILAAFLYVAVSNRTLAVSVEEMFAIFSPIGRWLLIIMYFYGTFHKLNPGFMSIESSCAVPFINGVPILHNVLASDGLAHAAIYGTLIFESIAMLLLLSARTKYFGMLLGMSFHFIIGISDYGTLAHFSAFALALHTLFLPAEFGERIRNETLVPAALKKADNFRVATILLVVLQVALALHMAVTRQGVLVNSLFAIFAVLLMFLVFKYGQLRQGDAPYQLSSRFISLNLISVWFFLHCASPYIGLGTGGTIAMFSGLRTEGGTSNHYIISKPVPLFSYQDTVLYVEKASNPNLMEIAEEGQGMVMFDFQRHFSHREPLGLPVTLNVNGVSYTLNTPDDVALFGNKFFTKQSWLERKYMSFRLVDDKKPKQCRH